MSTYTESIQFKSMKFARALGDYNRQPSQDNLNKLFKVARYDLEERGYKVNDNHIRKLLKLRFGITC